MANFYLKPGLLMLKVCFSPCFGCLLSCVPCDMQALEDWMGHKSSLVVIHHASLKCGLGVQVRHGARGSNLWGLWRGGIYQLGEGTECLREEGGENVKQNFESWAVLGVNKRRQLGPWNIEDVKEEGNFQEQHLNRISTVLLNPYYKC